MSDRVLAALVAAPFLLGAAAAPAAQPVDSRVVFSFQDSDIVESSGLAVVSGLVVTTNDSGDTGRVFAVDAASGDTVATIAWEDAPTDVEALAPTGHGGVWVGDIGDNTGSRDRIQVAALPVGSHSADVDPVVYDLVYPDGAHDAETLMTDPADGRLYVATKSVLGGTLYVAPAKLDPHGPNRLEPVADVLPIATDGAFFPDGRHLVIRNYWVAVVYAFPSLEKVGSFQLPSQPQGEGLAVEGAGTLLLSSEGLHSKVLRVTIPDALRAAMAGATPSASAPPSPSQTTTTQSHEGSELSETTDSQRSPWPWFLGGLIGVAFIVVLTRSLRRR